MSRRVGPVTREADDLHAAKYRQRGEDFREAMGRVAFALADGAAHYRELREVLLDMRFCPAGRVQSAMGSTRQTTPYNCLSGDTELLTDRGFRSLRDAVGETLMVLSPVSGDFERAEAKCYGAQRLFEVTISNSKFGQARSGSFSVFATAEHRWVLQDGSVTQDLKVGDLLKSGRSDVDVDPRGFAHGLVFGDGTRQRPGKFLIRLCGAKSTHLPAILAAYPAARVTYPQSAGGDPYVAIVSDVDMKSLPPADEPGYIRGFVEGLLAADGCFVTRGNDPFQFHGSEDVVRWVRDRLVLADYAPCGGAHCCSDGPTNYGERTVPLWKQHFRRAADHRGYRVLSITARETEQVYCVEEPKYRQITLRNGLSTGQCYVSGTVEDSYVNGPGSIMGRAVQAAATLRMGGGIGYDFSTLRPRGSLIAKLDSASTGPVSFMNIFNAVGDSTSSTGDRRGAQMAVLRVDHPDVEEFVRCKQRPGAFERFNVSVAVTDRFMECLSTGAPFPLVWGGRTVREVDAAALWETVMRSTWDWAEPGVLFVDAVNRANNLWYCETIAATNPCGEQPLPPFGACLLGSFNLTKYVCSPAEIGDLRHFDFDQLFRDVAPVVRGMDNVVDRAKYPLPEQEAEARSKRRMGLGVFGLANAAEACGCAYGSPEFVGFERGALATIRDAAYLASARLAAEKGSFPLFDAEKYLSGPFVRSLPKDVRHEISVHGIRNSHLTSIAPTGTISMCADNASSGVEPVFAHRTKRVVIMPTGPEERVLEDYAVREWGVLGRVAADVTPREHVDVLCAAQALVDSAVSKTVNVSGACPWDEFKDLYRRAWEGGAKGCTTFNSDGQRDALLTDGGADACRIDPETGRRECG